MPSLLRPRGRHHRQAITESAGAPPIKAQAPAGKVQRAGYVWGIPPQGMDENQAGLGASTQTDRKSHLQELYEAYLSCPWAWASVQAIARTITAGGLVSDWVNDSGEGNQTAPDKPPAVLALERLLAFTNPTQNIRQLCRNFIADLLVFGDAYIEVVWIGSVPAALYNLDCPTTTPISDAHGNISGYVQVTDFGQRAEFDTREVIHVSLDAARPSVTGVSPMDAAIGPVTSWLFAAATAKEAFKKGLPATIHADFPSTSQDKDQRTWRDQYSTRNIGARNIGAPIITKGGVNLKELQPGKITDVIVGKNQCRDEILSIFGVPPAQAGVIESGNLGGGTGESQARSFLVNTCGPIEELVAEALNYALAQQAFGIDGWVLKFGDVDWRDSVVVENIRDQRLRNGAWTLNRYRAEIGEPPVAGGDDAVLVDRQNLVLWSQMRDMSSAMIASKGAPAVAAGEQPPNGEPLNPGQDDDQGGEPVNDDGNPPAETLLSRQVTAYQTRLAAALAAIRPITETQAGATGTTVYDQLAGSFPTSALGWVNDADWEGPVNVGAAQIDTEHRDEWAASHDGTADRYRTKLRSKIAAGKHPKPVVLVRTPGSAKDVVIDGHHRTLAAMAEARPVWAYVGRVDADTGPWDELHASQLKGNR